MQLQPVVWAKGTFLTSQHLQVQDRFLEDTLHFHVEALAFCPWGFKQLHIDRAALNRGDLLISKASGILPDGLPFDIPSCDAPVASRLSECFDSEETKVVEVVLGIPPWRTGGVNIASSDSRADTRFIASSDVVRDENTGQKRTIQVAKRNLSLSVRGKTPGAGNTLPIARVERTEPTRFQLDPHFVPPLLNIFASEYLTGLATRLNQALGLKSTELSSLRRQKTEHLAAFTVADLLNFWFLFSINSHLPLFRDIVENHNSHPMDLFSTMLSLAGCLTTFSPSIRPRDLPPYDHVNLGHCFKMLEDKLTRLLEVMRANFVALPFKLSGPYIYSVHLDKDRDLTNATMYISFSAESQKEDLIRNVPKLVKVASTTRIDPVISGAVAGIPLQYIPSPPIPVRLEYEYFEIKQEGRGWQDIVREASIAAYIPKDISIRELQLVIVFGD